MTESPVWVVGAGGLLGGAVATQVESRLPGTRRWQPTPPHFSWDRPGVIEAEFSESTAAYARAVEAAERPWMVLWCAGAGTVASAADFMARETAVLESFLLRLAEAVGKRPGCFFLAGSAGGVYAGSSDLPLTEKSAPVPLSAYGREKLRQEELLVRWAAGRAGVSTFVGRLSNLYGPRQNLAKPQGLIAHLSRCLVHHVPAQVYAPLDTLRDHLDVQDAAARILICMDRLRGLPETANIVKILASEQTATIGAILSAFRKIAQRQPRIISSGSAAGRLQPSRLSLKSVVWADAPFPAPTPLAVGIHRVYQAQLALFQAGALPRPGNPTGKPA